MTLRDKAIEVLAKKLETASGFRLGDGATFPLATAAFDAMTQPLVWEQTKDKNILSCGDYAIVREGQVFEVWLAFTIKDEPLLKGSTLAAAQAAAEDHYLRTRYAGTKLMEGLE